MRLSVNVNDETGEFVTDYTGRKGITVTEATRRAFAALRYLDEAQRKGIQVYEEEDGKLRELAFLI